MNLVMIIPTGLAAKIGGHAGDGSAAAKLMASTCDLLITHPNVVNASDINEMTENTLYVEGSMLDRFLYGEIELKQVYKNKILLAVNEITTDVINSVNAARATIGAEIEILKLQSPLEMIGTVNISEIAGGKFAGVNELIRQVRAYDFHALAISTPIHVDKDTAENYLEHSGANPWGWVEAQVSKLISKEINKPVAHSPMDNKDSEVYEVMKNLERPVDPRMSAELVSVSYLHCILKGLHKAPRIGKGISKDDVDFLISPTGIWGEPHRACTEAGIPIIMVTENSTYENKRIPGHYEIIRVENYLEAAGYIQSIKAGVSVESIRRPLKSVEII